MESPCSYMVRIYTMVSSSMTELSRRELSGKSEQSKKTVSNNLKAYMEQEKQMVYFDKGWIMVYMVKELE